MSVQNVVLSIKSAVVIVMICTVALGAEPTPVDVFNSRIMPIFKSEQPSSCVQCHLASVDLKNYILPSSDATFVSLRDQGLIDVEQPANSKILELIRMGEKDVDVGAKLIHADMRKAELAAFSDWVRACCADSRLRELPAAKQLARPKSPDGVIRHARKSRVVDSFVRNVWSQRMRCFPCHTPHEIDPENPRHQVAVKKRKEFGEQYGEEMLQRLAIFRETPEETLEYLIESSLSTPADQLPLINLAYPAESLLVQKPMSKLPKKKADGTFEAPTYRFPLSHMGGLKLHPNDQSYKSIVGWITDYAKVVDGQYKSVDELPADNWHPSQLVVRLKNAPEAWQVGAIVQLFVHGWNAEQSAWTAEPIAFTQGTVTPRRMVNGALFLLGTDDSRARGWLEEAKLPAGRYLVRVYLDGEGKISNDPAALLSVSDFQGEVEIAKARWRPRFRFAEVVDGEALGAASAQP